MHRFLSILTVMIFTLHHISAQTTYNMSNAFTTDCQGTLLDSEGGVGGTTYANNENYIFTICSGGKITLTWSSTFCIDSGFDWLKVYNGSDTNSALLGTYTGNTAPPTLIANSGCLTFHFTSDASAAYCGWEADWTTEKVAPIPPNMTINPAPACSTNQIILTFDDWIPCDSIDPGDFTISGPVNNLQVNTITSSLNCQSAGDTTNTLTLHLNKAMNQNCYYTVDFELGLPDNCDSLWYFNLVDSFLVDDCSFTVDIQAVPDTICSGMCTDLTTIVSGNGPSCLSYNYTWNHGLPNSAGPHNVCPVGNIIYTVTVSPTSSSASANTMKSIVFVDPTINESDTITVCQSVAPFNLNVLGSGGRFSGNGITNTTLGTFNPDSAGAGSHWIKYGFTNFCEDSILIIVYGIDAGLPQAACPGTAPFMLSGFSPPGGTWSGDSVTAAGLFNPALPGTYVLTYSVNGCTEQKVVSVDSIVLNTPLDTVCQTDTAFAIGITPPGGRWSGTGIVDSVLGIFDPSIAGSGTFNLTYKLSGIGNSGCSFNINVTVNPVEAYWNLLACPTQPPFTLNPQGSPSGGQWSGLGITNSSTGAYSPAQAFSGSWTNDTLTYTAPNGCTDKRIVYIRYTRVYDDTNYSCVNDPAFWLVWSTVRRTPGGGIWTGNGLTRIGNNYRFTPSVAGVGTHKLYYTANTCVDSIIMVVYPTEIKKAPFNYLWPDTIVCSTHPTWNFPPMPPGGKWIGSGITNRYTGKYNPGVAGTGTHTIKYVTPNGCISDSVLVTVYPFVPAQILNLDTSYCYSDTLIPITLKPPKGKLTGPGIVNGTFFNPAEAGEGRHTLSYTFGNGFCETSTSMSISITTELITNVSISDTLLCPGETSTISVEPAGGPAGSQYTFEWDNGLFPVGEHSVSPQTSTLYIVKTMDGCSDPAIDSIFIHVADDIEAQIESSDKQCYGAEGYLKVILDSLDKYDIVWNTKPEQITDSIEGLAGSSYIVTVTDKITGCTFDTLAKIPAFKNVVASFSTSPNLPCIPSNQKTVFFIDLSQNADSGNWDIAGLQQIPYELGKNPTYTFTEAGYYTITLTVFNEGGCSDTYEMEICVEDIRPVFVADAFTPNGDGVNDVLHVKAKGVKDVRFVIFDRWGNVVFETEDINEGWDGTFRGQPANPGVYVYLVESKLINNEKVVEKGDVTLIR